MEHQDCVEPWPPGGAAGGRTSMSAKSTCSILANASIVLDTSCSTYAGRFPVVPHRTL